jgi:hypothetical protein
MANLTTHIDLHYPISLFFIVWTVHHVQIVTATDNPIKVNFLPLEYNLIQYDII